MDRLMSEHPHVALVLRSIANFRARRIDAAGLQANLSAVMMALEGDLPRRVRQAIVDLEAAVELIRFTSSGEKQVSALEGEFAELEGVLTDSSHQ